MAHCCPHDLDPFLPAFCLTSSLLSRQHGLINVSCIASLGRWLISPIFEPESGLFFLWTFFVPSFAGLFGAVRGVLDDDANDNVQAWSGRDS